jgi:hypothetical protein
MKKVTLEHVQAMKPKEICYHDVRDLTDEAFEWVHEAHEINSCDKCGGLDKSEYLIWLSEDYTPFGNEFPSREFFEAWGNTALCDKCYHEELEICRDVI